MIRPAGPPDADALLALMRDYCAEDGYPFDAAAARTALERLLEDPALGRVWVVVEEDELAGYAALTFGYSLEYLGRDAFVDEIYLRPASRARGYGRGLLAVLEQACREPGVRALHLEVERAKPDVNRLYRSLGFTDNDRQLLTKRLDPRTPAEPAPEETSAPRPN